MANCLLTNRTFRAPQQMIPIKMKIRTTFFALMTISLLACWGCKPTVNQESSTSTISTSSNSVSGKAEENAEENAEIPEASDTNAGEVAFTANTVTNVENRDSDAESMTISGDLSSVDWQSMLGKEISITGKLVVVDNYDLARRGQVKVARDRLYIPTNRIDPNDSDPKATSFEGGSNVAKVIAAEKQNDQATVIIDDGSAAENVFPPTLFPGLGKTHPTVRVGSEINGVSGKLVKAGRVLLLVPSKPLEWTPAQRPERPNVGDAKITAASFNVLNYFTTIDDGDNDARGADSEAELKRQEAKLVSAIIGLQADVIGLMELENNLQCEERLVAALNQAIGKEVFKGCGLPDGFREAPGGKNAIRVGVIYRTDRVSPVGDVSMISDEAFAAARTPIVQKFKSNTVDAPFAFIVNHFKSKGGSSRADVADKNKGDGQGAYNATRRSQSLAICNYIDKLKQDQGAEAAPRVIVVGDLNAYGQEDPVDAMRANGLVDLHQRFGANDSSADPGGQYSYIYYGQSGSLDHAFATESMATSITGVATWHINSDEPRFLDYNQEHNPELLYKADPFRSSDHDPVLIGIGN